jgi:hypothetical protein
VDGRLRVAKVASVERGETAGRPLSGWVKPLRHFLHFFNDVGFLFLKDTKTKTLANRPVPILVDVPTG